MGAENKRFNESRREDPMKVLLAEVAYAKGLPLDRQQRFRSDVEHVTAFLQLHGGERVKAEVVAQTLGLAEDRVRVLAMAVEDSVPEGWEFSRKQGPAGGYAIRKISS